MDKTHLENQLKDFFKKAIQKDKNIKNAFMLIHSDKYNLHLNMAEGTTEGVASVPNQPFHIASIGKLFTSVLTSILVEKNEIFFDDSISLYLDEELLKGLHIYKGIDYTDQIKIKHLMNHTSGLNDYFEDTPKNGKSMLQMIEDDPYRSWKPREIILWSKSNLKTHFPPGRGFHYSDTGYHLLGLILEKITKMPLAEAMDYYIFSPLEMHHSYLASHSEPKKKSAISVADVYMKGVNAKDFSILKDDYAGGGIVAPAEDLLKFMKALVHHKLIKEETFEKMKDWAGFFNLFFIGIDYGYGLMNFKTIPLVMPSKYNVWGNAGSIGSFMFYHPLTDSYFIGSLNNFRYHRKGIRLMFKAIDILLKKAPS
ncbi:serine hydrolase domain-containing protein [Alkaliphilus transvaalensis]|uniref:serine hydrolase domain-containing protein n=1 Tax=Alkaliphilus transvaalensis TaxID=114628 RepID=UPI00047DA245|nr:serine hydrolase domain-containing protein [Alkaliphilus transvaalensis]